MQPFAKKRQFPWIFSVKKKIEQIQSILGKRPHLRAKFKKGDIRCDDIRWPLYGRRPPEHSMPARQQGELWSRVCSINLITFHFYSDPTTTALAALLSLSWQIFRNNGKGTTNQQYQQTSLSLILFVGNIWYLHNFGKQFSLYLYSGHYIAATDSSWPKFLAAESPLTTTTAPPADTVFITKWIFGLIQNVSLMMHLLCSTLPY